MSKIEIKKTVANKNELDRVVSTEFLTFVDNEPSTQLTTDEFFREYDRLFYEIPPNGETNSHEYLASRSGDQANLDPKTQDIQPLLDEIASLREQLIEANITIASLQGIN